MKKIRIELSIECFVENGRENEYISNYKNIIKNAINDNTLESEVCDFGNIIVIKANNMKNRSNE